MKKILSTIVCALLAVAAMAQTNFRELSYSDALTAAKAEQKLVFIDFMTDWCGPCKMMSREVFPQEQLGKYMNAHFVCIKINAEKGEGVELAKQYKVTAYPTFIVVSPDKQEVGRVVGGRGAAEFEAEMERLINPDKKPDVVKQRYADGDRSTETVKAYAAQLMAEAMEDRQNYAKHQDEAVKAVQEYFATLTDEQRQAEENLFVYQDYTKALTDASAQYLVKSLKKWNAQTREAARTAAQKLMEDVLMGYFTGYKKVDAAVYEQGKKDIKALKLDEDGTLAKLQQFIDVYVKGDMDQYISYVDQHFDSLPDEKQQYLANMFSSLFQDCDADTQKKAARCLRNHLSNLPYNVIYFSAMEIGKLEGQGKR